MHCSWVLPITLCNMHSLPDRWSDKDPPQLPTPAQEWLQGKFCRKPPYFSLVHASTPGFPYFFPELTDPYRSTRHQHWSDWPSGTWQSRPRHWSSVTTSARKDSWHGGPCRPMANGGRHWSLVKVQVSSNSKVQKSESHDSRFFFWRENPSAASKANKLISMLLYIMISFSTIGAIAIAMFRGGYTQSLKFKKGSSKTLQNLPRINITKVYQKELTSKEPRVQMHIPRYRHSALARVHGAAIWHNPWRISQLHPFLWISW